MKGSSFGGIVYPIMLNQLFHGSVGFAWGVRATGFLSLGFLFAANCLMSTRGLSKIAESKKPTPKLLDLVTDAPYVAVNVGCVAVLIHGAWNSCLMSSQDIFHCLGVVLSL